MGSTTFLSVRDSTLSMPFPPSTLTLGGAALSGLVVAKARRGASTARGGASERRVDAADRQEFVQASVWLRGGFFDARVALEARDALCVPLRVVPPVPETLPAA